MADKHTDGLAQKFQQIVGDEYVVSGPELTIAGIAPACLVSPANPAEVAACLKLCQSWPASVVPAGAMTWLDCGNPLRSADVVITLRRLNRIVDYSAPDLTITVEAGVCLTELNRLVREQKQWLPLDPPGDDRMTVGAVAACASMGPLRFGFGGPRDYLLGLRLVHADGSESKSGGRVVKNVAGYDMNKLYAGSFGTLAVITQATFKLRPLPEISRTLAIAPGRTEVVFEGAREILKAGLRPASVFAINELLSRRLGLKKPGPSLLVRFIEGAEAVEYQVNKALALAGQLSAGGPSIAVTLDDAEADRLWGELSNIDRLGNTTLCLSVPVSKGESTAGLCGSNLPESLLAADIGAGTIRVAFDASADESRELTGRMREAAKTVGGSVFVERGRVELKEAIGAWNDPGPPTEIMRAIKDKFDPGSILSPGRFVAGI
jgi:glycolate oxidase FAD binding subunit